MKCLKILDGRKIPREAKEQLRIAAVKRVEGGESPESVASGLGINRRQIYRWLQAYHYGGLEALRAKPIPGAPTKLTVQQMEKIAHLVRANHPQQLKFEFALWTLAIIREVIRREFDVRLSEVSVGRLMRRLGFSPQRPLYRASQQDAALVEDWRTHTYPALAARARQENALIFFADEAGIRSDYHAGTTWAPVGETPVLTATGARFGLNMLSAVNAQGHFRFMTVEGNVNATVFKTFLTRLIAGMDRKIILVVDGHPIHKARLVQQYVQEHATSIELVFLPPYAPEVNPDELAWAHVKSSIAKATAQTKEQLQATIHRVMCRLQKMPHIVSSFFRHPSCAYANL